MMSYFIFETTDDRQRLEGRYWNCQGTGIAIVASITKGIDWAAYIGIGAVYSLSEIDTLNYVSANPQYSSVLNMVIVLP